MTPLPIAVLISGGGTTLRNLLEFYRRGELPIDFRLVVSSHSNAGGLAFAKEARIESRIISRRNFEPEQHCQSVFDCCRESGVQLVVMGGYLDHLLIPTDFENRVVNIHPSLIPAFCGRGFYGLKVHRSVVEYGAKLTGCTVHFVDNEFDHGPIIAQASCPVEFDDTPESVQKRVFDLECQLYPETIRQIALGRVSVVGRRVSIRSSFEQ